MKEFTDFDIWAWLILFTVLDILLIGRFLQWWLI